LKFFGAKDIIGAGNVALPTKEEALGMAGKKLGYRVFRISSLGIKCKNYNGRLIKTRGFASNLVHAGHGKVGVG